METNATRMCERLVGLPDVNVLAVDDQPDAPIVVHIEARLDQVWCPSCGGRAEIKDRPSVLLGDLPCFGRPAQLAWHKHRLCCPEPACERRSWTHVDERIAAPRSGMTTRAARWATVQVGRCGRTVNEVAAELGCDWHTVNRTVLSYGDALLAADVDRVGTVSGLGLDETLFVRTGRWRTQQWCTSIVALGTHDQPAQLIDVVPQRSATRVIDWLDDQPDTWRSEIRWGVLDLSGPYRKVFDEALDHVTQIADPFHVVKLANTRLDECRRRVQNPSATSWRWPWASTDRPSAPWA